MKDDYDRLITMLYVTAMAIIYFYVCTIAYVSYRCNGIDNRLDTGMRSVATELANLSGNTDEQHIENIDKQLKELDRKTGIISEALNKDWKKGGKTIEK